MLTIEQPDDYNPNAIESQNQKEAIDYIQDSA